MNFWRGMELYHIQTQRQETSDHSSIANIYINSEMQWWRINNSTRVEEEIILFPSIIEEIGEAIGAENNINTSLDLFSSMVHYTDSESQIGEFRLREIELRRVLKTVYEKKYNKLP